MNKALIKFALKMLELEYSEVYKLRQSFHDSSIAAIILTRANAWLHTCTKCDSPADLQAAASAARALIEMHIDASLLIGDPQQYEEKYRAWTYSARLHVAEAKKKWLDERLKAEARNDRDKYQLEFIRKNRDKILKDRDKHWPREDGKLSHPPRWTNRNLLADAIKADKVKGDGNNERLYEEYYREACWYVHASGTPGLTGLNPKEVELLHCFYLSLVEGLSSKIRRVIQ